MKITVTSTPTSIYDLVVSGLQTHHGLSASVAESKAYVLLANENTYIELLPSGVVYYDDMVDPTATTGMECDGYTSFWCGDCTSRKLYSATSTDVILAANTKRG